MTGELRSPRSIVKVNGVAAAFKQWAWEANTLYQADTFRVRFPMSDAGDLSADWWSRQKGVEIELLAGFPADPTRFGAGELQSLMVGKVDDVDMGFDGRTIDVTGRDLTGGLIDHKTSEKWPNKTASQIATLLAERRGLTPKVTATSRKAGTLYATDQVRLESQRTEWDVLCWLAREEGYICHVDGRELHFAPKPGGGDVYKIEYLSPGLGRLPSSNMARVYCRRSLTVARGVRVTVRSFNSKRKRAFSKSASRGGGSDVQQYVYTIPGLEPEQAQLRANKLLDELSQHEMRLSVDGPADNLLTKTSLIGLSGTGTAFDQTYYPETVSREFSADEGYRWRIDAKNHSPESEPGL